MRYLCVLDLQSTRLLVRRGCVWIGVFAVCAVGLQIEVLPVARAASLVSGIEPAESIVLPSGESQYFYVGSTAGGQPMSKVTWRQRLKVIASYSGNEAISIGTSLANAGSYISAAGNHAIAGAGISGYSIVRSYRAHISATGAGAPEGTKLTLHFKTHSGDLVLLLIGGEGTGTLELSGIVATTLQNATYSEAGSNVIASAAIYTAELPEGWHGASWTSTSFPTNAGTSLGAVAYILRP
jgi:hypothetical protein